ncbi:hypothetical protein [Streptomyces roseicoloratus]|uniref:hypothetical protein n=1 Tax=Streptomyces roseicoloratus TaxID=2508722 RepID=UPI001009F600|nr:hypothetical protein [Streptomyces roseicoloratus]
MECALGREATARALGRYRRRVVWGTAAGAVLVGLGLGFGLLPGGLLPGVPGAGGPGAGGGTWARDVAAGLCTAGVLMLLVGLGALRTARMMRRTLAAGPWSAHPAVAVVRGGMTPATVVLSDPDAGRAWPLVVAATRQRYERVRPGPDAVLWWCGDPGSGGVLAPPGGAELVWARPVRGHHTRRRAVGLAAAAGLLDRPAAMRPRGSALRPEVRRTTRRRAVLRRGPEAPVVTGAVTHPPAPRVGPVDDAARPPLTYATLTAAAGRQAVPRSGRHRPEADVRVVPWWRVRSLRRVADLPRTAAGLVTLAIGCAALLLRPEDASVQTYAVVAIGAGLVLHAGHRLLTTGRRTALRLAEAARSPEAVPGRYALLSDPYGGTPVLLVFPAGDGAHNAADDLPEGVLRLFSPGLRPRTWTWPGLPSAPSGAMELRGGTSRAGTAAGGGPFLVPWIEGRPVWPVGPYEELRAGDPAVREFLERLAPPQVSSADPGASAGSAR